MLKKTSNDFKDPLKGCEDTDLAVPGCFVSSEFSECNLRVSAASGYVDDRIDPDLHFY